MAIETDTTLLTVAQVAEQLNCSKSLVYNLLASGELRHFVLGNGQGGKRVSPAQLADYLRRKERGDGPKRAPEPPLKHIRSR
jgi:excisionase family DNA binding protein